MAALPVGTRLVYMGLWGLADDAGFLELPWSQAVEPTTREPAEPAFDVSEIAGELFRHDAKRTREHRVDLAIGQLVDLGKVELLECRSHALIPTLPDHRIKGGELLFTIQKRHERRCSIVLRRTTSDYVSVSVSDSVSDSSRASARKASPTKRNGAEPMSPVRAESILADPSTSEEAKAGARGYLQLRSQWGRPSKGGVEA